MLAAANNDFSKYTPDTIAQFIQWEFIEKDGEGYKCLFPEMTESQYAELCNICSEAINETTAMIANVIPIVTEIMENHAPAAVKDQCGAIARLNTDGMADIIDNLCENGYLMIPNKHSFLTIFTVV